MKNIKKTIQNVIIVLVLLLLLGDTQNIQAACTKNVTGYTCKGHGHDWSPAEDCGGCSDGYTYTTCTKCSGKGYTTTLSLRIGCTNCGGKGKFDTNTNSSTGTVAYVKGKGYTSRSVCKRCSGAKTNYKCNNSDCPLANTRYKSDGSYKYDNWAKAYEKGYITEDEYTSCYTHTGTLTTDCGNSTAVYGDCVSNGTYQYDGSNHWTNCKHCSGKMGSTVHTNNGKYQSNVSSHWTNCSVCGAAMGTTAHTSNGKYQSNASSHWTNCSSCGTAMNTAAHTSNGKYQYDTTYHWTNCSTCSLVLGKTGHSFGAEWTSGGYRYQTCGCGYQKCNGAITYTISYNGNGATSGSTASSAHTYDTGAYLTGNGYKRTGYTFLGWSASSTATSASYSNGQWVSNLTQTHGGTVTLYAVWQRNAYKVTYNANGGSTSATTGTYYYNTAVSLSPTASKSGYTFVGWSTNPNDSKPLTSLVMPDLATSSNSSYSSDWELTLYALYSIDVSDVSNHTYPSYSKVNPNEVQLMVWNLSTPNNYKFYPLTYISDAGIMYYTYQLSSTDLASFVGSADYGYKVVAYDNAGNYSTLLSGTKTSTNPPPANSNPSIPVYYWQKVDHYKYDQALGKWIYFDTTSNNVLSGSTYTPSYVTPPAGYQKDHIDAAYTVTTTKTSNAYYVPVTYTLTFHPNGGSVSPTTKSIKYGDYYGQMPTPVQTGHSFTGWYTAASGGTKISDKTIYATSGNSTVYAHWNVNNYNVTYDYWTNGGTSVTQKTASAAYNSNVNLSITASKPGWTFVGWNTDPNAQTGLSSIKIGADDMVLYAIYKKDITATFIEGMNKSTNTITKTIYNLETSCTIITRPIAEINGWDIRGWSYLTTGNATIHVSPNVELKLNADKTFYACYEQEITISYDTNGSPQSIPSETGTRYFNASGNYTTPAFVTAKAPVFEKHSFVRWEELGTNGTVVNYYPAKETITADHSFTLVSKWDRYPEIEAYDRYFTLEQAKNGEITHAKLLEKVTGTDKEDGILVNGTSVMVKDYGSSDFTNITTDAEIKITYQAKDSFGNIVEKSITVYIVDTTVIRSPISYYIRFIQSDFYKYEDNLVSEPNGGLASTSIWRTNLTYQQLLEHALSSETPEQSFSFSKE